MRRFVSFTDRSCSSAPCGLPLPTSGSVPSARLSLRSKFRALPQGLCAAVGKLRFSGNLQCPKALLQYCGNRSLPQCCGNTLRHCGLLQCAQCIAAMAPLRHYCGNEVLQQYCSNVATIAVLQQHCGNAHCKVLLQYCGNRGHCGNAFWYCSNTPIFSRCCGAQ